MTLPLLYYAFNDFWLPPEPEKPPLKKGGKPRRAKPRRPLPAEARWFLWQWSRVFGLDQTITGHVATLRQRLGTPPEQWRRVMRMLKDSGVMLTSGVPRPSGRPISEYRISAEVRYDLANLTVPDLCHHPEIARVLGEGTLPVSVAESGRQADRGVAKPPSPAARTHRLSPANRWLIAVLLAHAETAGRVSGLSDTRLGRLTGMSYSQLRSQFAKLREQGVLADHQPGRRCRLFGSQMTPIFLFDLHHPLFGLNDRVGLDVVLFSPNRQGQQDRSVVNGLVEALFVAAHAKARVTKTAWREADSKEMERDHKVVQYSKDLLPRSFDPGPLASRLARAYDPHTARWLLARLQGYAMQLLSHGWNTLSKGKGGADDPVARVIDAIARDFPEGADQAESLKEPPNNAVEAERDAAAPTDGDTNTGVPYALYAPHVVVFYALAYHLAVELQNELIKLIPKPEHRHLRDLSFRQMPTDPQRRSFLERPGYVRRGPFERPMNFCLTPADHRGNFLWKMRGYLRCGTGQRPTHIPLVPLEIVKNDMTTWLSERPAIVDPGPPARLSGKRFGRRGVSHQVLSQPLEPPEGE